MRWRPFQVGGEFSMEGEFKTLRNFSEAELIFDEQETKAILRFFFQGMLNRIETLEVTTEIRNLAQGMLVEAVDATYAMGWIELTFKWVTHPSSEMKKALQKLARQALRYWFSHLKDNQSLLEAKIYDSIRADLGRAFGRVFGIMLEAKYDTKRPAVHVAFVRYKKPRPTDRLWG